MAHSPVYDYFLHNFADTVEVETSWSTDVSVSATKLAEERRALIERPFRTIRLRWVAASQDEVERMTMALARIADQRFYVPLWPDQTAVVDMPDASTIHGTFGSSRFYAGQKVLTYAQSAVTNRITARTLNTIATVIPGDPGALTLSAPQAIYSFPNGFVVPLILCEVMLDGLEIAHDHERLAEVNLLLKEVTDHTAIPSSTPSPPNYAPLTSFPIFYVEGDWRNQVKTRLFRQGSKFQRGRTEVVYVQSPRPIFEHEFLFSGDDRASFWNLLTFFDGRMGRLIPFYVIAPNALWTPVAFPDAHTVKVKAIDQANPEDVADFIDFVGLVGYDGTKFVTKLDTFTFPGDGFWYFGTHDAIPGGLMVLANVRRFTRAHLVRFSDDAMKEIWHSVGEKRGVYEVTWNVRDVLNEEGVEVDNPIANGPGCTVLGPGGVNGPGNPAHAYVYTRVTNGIESPASPATLVQLPGNATVQVQVVEAAPTGTTQLRFYRSKLVNPLGTRYLCGVTGPPPTFFNDSLNDAGLGPPLP